MFAQAFEEDRSWRATAAAPGGAARVAPVTGFIS